MRVTSSRLPLAACAAFILSLVAPAPSDAFSSFGLPSNIKSPIELSAASSSETATIGKEIENGTSSSSKRRGQDELFRDFANYLQTAQTDIISKIESVDGSGEVFSEDRWGGLVDLTGSDQLTPETASGGITRVIQRGAVIEKGACSLTFIQNGKLTAERAAAISGRNDNANVKEGDGFSAAALSIVLHTRSPNVPTFRSDVRVFLVKSEDDGDTLAWFGGGADLTPYYLFDEDVKEFHGKQKQLCDGYFPPDAEFADAFSYAAMKKKCDAYFFLPARQEHRGVGGAFYDDMLATENTLAFTKAMAESWLPSWLPIVERRKDMEYTDRQREWQLLRRGRYLEFNLLYDRGVQFGLANANPRVEGVMVSAPPLIAWEYNHVIEEGSEEERLMTILKEPIDWA